MTGVCPTWQLVKVSWNHSWGGKGIWSWKKQVPNRGTVGYGHDCWDFSQVEPQGVPKFYKSDTLSCSANHLGSWPKIPQKIGSWIPFNWERANLSEFFRVDFFFLSSKLVIAWITEVFTMLFVCFFLIQLYTWNTWSTMNQQRFWLMVCFTSRRIAIPKKRYEKGLVTGYNLVVTGYSSRGCQSPARVGK